ncbi:MAG: hypothetical protein ACFE91_13375 [Promethearchaeota archaeon]
MFNILSLLNRQLKRILEKIERDRNYKLNFGLIGIVVIQKAIDTYLTYKALEEDENFVELNPFMKRIIRNKPLVYFLNGLYGETLLSLNYLAKKVGDHYNYPDLNKVATVGLGINILGNFYVIGRNLYALREMRERAKI